MTSLQGKFDRVTGKAATIYTPPEDLVDAPHLTRPGLSLGEIGEVMGDSAAQALKRNDLEDFYQWLRTLDTHVEEQEALANKNILREEFLDELRNSLAIALGHQ